MPQAEAETAPPVQLIQLTYARQPSRWRWWVTRLFILAWIAGFLWLAYDKWGVLARVRVALFIAERACLLHVEPNDRVVFEMDPARAAQLLKLPNYRPANQPAFKSHHSGLPPPKFIAAIYQGFDQTWKDYTAAAESNEAYQRTRDRLRAPTPLTGVSLFESSPDDSALIFMNGRNVSGYQARVLCIWAEWNSSANEFAVRGAMHVATTAGQSTAIVTEIQAMVGNVLEDPRFRTPDGSILLRLYAGQPDSADTSRFTIRYHASSGNGVIEGEIGVDDKVTLRILSGPIVVVTN